MTVRSGFALEFVASTELSDMFISYSREVAAVVQDVVSSLPTADLPASSFRVFLDVQSIRSGQLWDQALTRAVFQARTFMAVLSPEYCRSPMCMFELMLFLNRHFIEQILTEAPLQGQRARFLDVEQALLPLRISPCEIPAVLQRFHAPLIPEERPLPPRFLDNLRESIRAGVAQTKGLRLLNVPLLPGGVGPDRDMIGFYQPSDAAKRLLKLADWLLEDASLLPEARRAITSVAQETVGAFKFS